MRRVTLLSIPLLLAWSRTTPAQASPAPLCYHARPKPACSGFFFTNFGAYLVLGSDQTGDTPLREVADWGFMVNLDTRNAIGGSVFASVDRVGFGLGPAVRYRRWLSPAAALDVAVGTPLVTSTDNIRSGSVFGLVRWSPNHWFAVAARPELVRQPVFLGCGSTACNYAIQSHGRVSLGMEFGGVPGVVLTAAGGVVTLLLAALVAAADD